MKVMVINPTSCTCDPQFWVNGCTLEISKQEHHLGIERTPDNRATTTIQERVKLGRRAMYSLMGACLYGLNGVGPRYYHI